MAPRKKTSDIKLDILLGVSKAGSYSSTNNAVVNKLREIITKKLAAIEKDLITQELKGVEVAIVDNLIRDVTRFMDQMTNYCMRINFSTTGRDTNVYISDEKTGGSVNMGMKSSGHSLIIHKGHLEQWKTGKGQPFGIRWPSLAAETIRRKMRQGSAAITGSDRKNIKEMKAAGIQIFARKSKYNRGRVAQARMLDAGASSYYFRWTGDLRNAINGEIHNMLFGFKGLFNPSAQFVTTGSPAPGVRGDKIGTIKVRLFQRNGLPSALIDALNSGDYRHARDDESMLNKYLSERVAEKLGPSRSSLFDNRRPWVGPSLAYWIINRFPYIVSKSIDDTIAEHKEIKKTYSTAKMSKDKE